MEFGLLGAAAVGMVCLYAVLRLDGNGTATAGGSRHVWDMALLSVVVGLFAGRIAAMILDGTNPLTNPADVLIVRGGVHTGVASAAALGAVGLAARRDLWRTADTLAPAALAGLAGWHGGCLITGTCLGTASSLPWAITGGGAVARHPVEVYAALALAIAAIGLTLWRRRLPRVGIVAGMALSLAAAIRLATEPLRLTIRGGPEVWYLAGIAAGLGIVAWKSSAGADSE